MKRFVDIIFSLLGLIVSSPIILPTLLLVWLQDYHSPFYIAPRVGKNGKIFSMVKLRSMVVNADKSGVDSTSANDNRITAVGRFIRRYKLDEMTQLWNVLKGDMSLVGPRPNVQRETELYTSVEQKLLSVRPGVTDLSSIVFSDEGDILEGHPDPDLAYNQLIRPWKSRLGLIYMNKSSLLLDFRIILITVKAIISRDDALQDIVKLLKTLNVEDEVLEIASRVSELAPYPPPGSDHIVQTR